MKAWHIGLAVLLAQLSAHAWAAPAAPVEPAAVSAAPAPAMPAPAAPPAAVPPSAPEAAQSPASAVTVAVNKAPVRSIRIWAITVEVGANGLAGMGPVITNFVTPRFAVDAGVGVSYVGIKSGIRARYNLRDGNWAPFVSLGVVEAGGGGDKTYKIDTGGNVFEYGLRSSTFVQGGAGVEYVGRRGLAFVAMVGGAKLCRDNVRPVSGIPTDSQKDDLDAAFGSGVVLSVAIGYAF